jgi:hypothetical protein
VGDWGSESPTGREDAGSSPAAAVETAAARHALDAGARDVILDDLLGEDRGEQGGVVHLGRLLSGSSSLREPSYG